MAAAPQLLIDLGIAGAALTGFIGALVLIAKLRPTRWLVSRVLGRAWRAVVADPLAAWFRTQVDHVVEPKVAELRGQVIEVVGELRTNGGGTVRDKIDSLVDGQAAAKVEAAAQVAVMADHIEDDRAAFERIEARLADDTL